MKEKNPLSELFNEEKETKTFAKIFDAGTVKAVDSLASRGIFDKIEFVISTGKEAHVFRAVDSAGNFRAVKIYKITTSDFNKMHQYIQGDRRFENVKKGKKELVHAWTRKEFKNLEKLNEAKVTAPLALAVKDNVLAMEFIGSKGIASRTLKESNPKKIDFQKTYEKLIEFMARMLYLEELVHADLSEYNILIRENEKNEFEPVVIDVGQGVMTMHPMAQEFFERDVQNIVNYFSKKGVQTNKEKAIEEIKKWKGKLLKEKKNEK